MPFYGCSVPAGSLTDEQKHELAEAITRIHTEVTGASPALVHVLFTDVPSAALYSGGEQASEIIIAGDIRAGRSSADKERILRQVGDACAAITGRSLDTLALVLRDVPAKNIFERGELAPGLGEDEAWLAALGAGRGAIDIHEVTVE
jgi:phenylpyruvate tautomerase PptA (4-oxalocrotonate tautomerase family)